MDKLSDIVKKTRNRIAQNELESVFDELFDFVSNQRDDCFDELISISKRYKKLNSDKRLGLLTYEEADVFETRITFDLLNFIREIEKVNRIIYGTSVKKNGQVEVLIEGEIEDFNQTRKENLKNAIAAILKIESDKVEIVRFIKGSIKIRIQLPEDKDVELAALFNRKSALISGLVSEFKILNIHLIENYLIYSRPIYYSRPVRLIDRFSFEPDRFVESIISNNESYIATAYEKVFKIEAEKFIRSKIYKISPLDSSDFTSDAFLSLVTAIKKGDFKEPLEFKHLLGYFLNTIRNQHLKRQKSTKPIQPFDPEYHSPIAQPFELGFYGHESDREEQLEKILIGLERLKPKCRKILELRFIDGLNFSTIAQNMKFKNQNLARQACYQCLKKLKEIIEEMN